LFGRGFATQFYFTAGAHYALPRQRAGRLLTQEPCDGPVIERITCGRSDSSVGRDFAFGNRADDPAKSRITYFIVAKRFLQDPSLEILRDGRLRMRRTVAESITTFFPMTMSENRYFEFLLVAESIHGDASQGSMLSSPTEPGRPF